MNGNSLSKRLETVASLCDETEIFADVGCDHGFLAIYLLNKKIIKKAVCTDINEGPLSRAKEHVRVCGFSNETDFCLSDGLISVGKDINPTAAAVCGMGGLMGVKILFDSDERFRKTEYFILQLQSDLNLVRIYLEMTGYRIETERLVFEEGKYYTAMKVSSVTKDNPVLFDNLDEVVSKIKKRYEEISVKEAVDFCFPYYEGMDLSCYREFLLFMIDKYENFVSGMNEKSKGYDEAARYLRIMKCAYKEFTENEG